MAINEITYNLELNSKPNSQGKFGLLLRITKDRKHRRVSLGLSIEMKYWKKHKNQRRYYLSKSIPNYAQIQFRITDVIEKAEKHFKETENQNLLSAKKTLKGQNRKSFIDFAEEKIKQYENSKSINYVKHVRSFLKGLKQYLNGEALMLDEISVKFLKNYESHLYSLGNSKNTISNKLKIIKSILYEAITEGEFQQEKNPFFYFKINRENNIKRDKLTIEEIEKIVQLNLQKFSVIWNVRNIFLFSFYCAGIRAADCIQLKWINISDGRLNYQMGKNKKWQDIKLVKPASDILSLYKTNLTGMDEFIFPFLDNSKDYSDMNFLYNQLSSKNALINKYLKSLALKAGINKKISFHISRHSFANIAKDKISIYELKEILNHSSVKETETYLASLNEVEKDSSIDKIFNSN